MMQLMISIAPLADKIVTIIAYNMMDYWISMLPSLTYSSYTYS